MRILMGAIRFPPAPGGAETHVFEISKELLNRGHDVKVLTSDLYRETPFVRLGEEFSNVHGIQVKRFRAFTPGGEYHYVIFPGVVGGMLKEKADIIHVHSYGYFHVNVAAFIRKIKRIPMVITPHFHPEWSMWGGERRKRMRRFYDRFIAGAVLESAEVIIGVSNHEIQQMKEYLRFDDSKVRYIPNGIDFSRFETIPDGRIFREKYGIPEEAHLILYTGRLAVNKGLDVLLRAFSLVLKVHPDSWLALVGDDHGMGDRLRSLSTELGISKRVIFAGHIHERLFRESYGAADVFVLPSEYEAFGIVLLEALACEVPCVATRVGGVPEVVRDGVDGYLVDYGDSRKLARAINGLLSDPAERKRMGKAGRNRVRKEFTWKKVVEKIEAVYYEIV